LGGLLLGIFVLIIFSAKVSGSQYNPAITLSFIFRRNTDKQFSRPLGIAYILFQVLGGFVASLLALAFGAEATNLGTDSSLIGESIVAELIGSFFLCFLYLTQTESKTKISEDPAITTLILAASYVASMLIVIGPDRYLSPLNPAVSLGIMFQQVYRGNAEGFKRIYIYLPFPLIGGLIAVFFHEFIYKRVQATIQESE
jgi:glycerol uptake facilitator-like aquaporin